MFASIVICLFQLVFSAETIFFSHNKSVGTVFRLVFSAKRTGPMEIQWLGELLVSVTVHPGRCKPEGQSRPSTGHSGGHVIASLFFFVFYHTHAVNLHRAHELFT